MTDKECLYGIVGIGAMSIALIIQNRMINKIVAKQCTYREIEASEIKDKTYAQNISKD